VRSGKAFDLARNAFARGGVDIRAEPAGTLDKAHPHEEIALRRQSRLEPVGPGDRSERGEIDVGGEVRRAGIGQYAVEGVVPDGLQRVAETRFHMAIIDEETGDAA